MMKRVEAVLEGDRLALARVITQIENDTQAGREALNQLFPHTGGAYLIGVTGAPGTGKSSLVNHLARYYRQPASGRPYKVAIVAVDPSSPFSGGAILGDRVRMRDLAGDEGVFIRSMASRGSLGGLSAATSGVVQALDAAKFDIILIETVGAGQAEVDIARLAHTTLVIEAPGLGDDIQAIKAGILEIADILVVNKADRPGAEATERALLSMLQLAHPISRNFKNNTIPLSNTKPDTHKNSDQNDNRIWIPPIIRTVATEGIGIVELGKAVSTHQDYLRQTGELGQREQSRLRSELNTLLRETLLSRWRESVPEVLYDQILDELYKRNLSPLQAVNRLLEGVVS